MPEKQGGHGQVSQQQQAVQYASKQDIRYSGEVLKLQKPALQQLKAQIMQMPPHDLQKYMDDKSALEQLYMQQNEV